MKHYLQQSNQGKRGERENLRRDSKLIGLAIVQANGPIHEKKRSANLQDSLRPLFHPAEGQHGKGQQTANAHADFFHGLRRPGGSGTRFTSSTQAVPEMRTPGLSLGSRTTQA